MGPLNILCAVFYLTLLSCAAAIYFDDKHLEFFDHASVSHIHSVYSHRQRRSADEFPHEIHFDVATRGSVAKLRLRRNAMADLNVPVYTLNNGYCVKEKTAPLTSASALYQDLGSKAAILVSRTNQLLEPFDLEGPLRINGSEFLMTPSRSLHQMDKGGRGHKLQRILSIIDFGHDFRDERTPVDKHTRAMRARYRKWRRRNRYHRLKRQTPVTHTVELVAVADYQIYARFLRYVGGSKEVALAEMKMYYVFMANLMDIRYQSVTTLDPTLIIRVALVSLVVTDVQSEAVWTENNRLGRDTVNSERALYSFRDWLRVNSNIPRADHWMLFTGYDLAEGSGTAATIGIAFIGTLCTSSAVSVVEEYFTATSGAVSAHELGHSLDADHDSTYQQCSDDDNNVMSTIAKFPREASRASNPWKFSPCSVDAFGAYLDTVQCALRPPVKQISTKEIAGLYLDADEQCELAMGPGSYFCRTVQVRLGFDLMCRRMYCYLPDDPGFCASIVPQEYTSCNDQSWCEKGLCKANVDAPRTIDNCPQGDEKGYDCRNANCNDQRTRTAYCCQTCAARRGITIPVSDSKSVSPPTTAVVVFQNPTTQAPSRVSTRPPVPPQRQPTMVPPSKTTTALVPTSRRPELTATRPVTSTTVTIEPTPSSVETTTPCNTFVCRCRQRFTIICFFLLRG